MSREWRLNPPPNWPLTAGVEVGLDWRPDPAWGPPPVGWQLWRRQRVSIRLLALPTMFGLTLGAVALVGALAGQSGTAPEAPTVERATLIGPGSFPAGPLEGTARVCPASYPGTGQLSDRWVAGGVRPTDC